VPEEIDQLAKPLRVAEGHVVAEPRVEHGRPAMHVGRRLERITVALARHEAPHPFRHGRPVFARNRHDLGLARRASEAVIGAVNEAHAAPQAAGPSGEGA
jgi:hypothetical protein